MAVRRDPAPPSWLYSFVDLAFLLLITVSQLDLSVSADLDLGELPVPQVEGEGIPSLPVGAGELWQVRVQPPGENPEAPFELVGATSARDAALERMGPGELRGRLERLRDEGARKPLLAPHEHSHSKDLLAAVALIEELWPTGRYATVAPVPPRPHP